MMAIAIFNGLNKPENCHHYMMKEMGKNHQEEIRKTIQTVTGSSVERLKETENGVGDVVISAKKMTDSVTASSAAIEEMISNIKSISQILEKNSAAVKGLESATQDGKKNLDSVSSLVADIEKSSKGLQEMSSVIQQIAEQTNLLAMNAAIEAAHAGTYGKGFAVVADEIRKLSENSGTEAKKISEVLSKMKSQIDSTFSSTVSAQKGFESVVQLSKQVTDQDMQVTESIREQDAGGQQLLETLHTMEDLTANVNETAAKLRRSTEQVKQEIIGLGQKGAATA